MNCEKCGKLMVERVKKVSGEKFWGCSGFPDCRNVKNMSPDTTKPEITQPQASKREYKLTEENIRSNALSSACLYVAGQNLKATPEQMIKFARLFEPYIRNG